MFTPAAAVRCARISCLFSLFLYIYIFYIYLIFFIFISVTTYRDLRNCISFCHVVVVNDNKTEV